MTPEIPMDALRRIARHEQSHGDLSAVAAYVEAVDAQADAAKDEALAQALVDATQAYWTLGSLSLAALSDDERGCLIAQARAARAHIAKEQQ